MRGVGVSADEDERWMRRALELARGTVGLASPNPQVGCVLVVEGALAGEGAHRYAAFDHAEIVALKQAAARGVDVSGATAYVTLEPCSHHGRTGPCADALISAGVKRVVVATIDPNPRVSGTGVARMRAAGGEVVVGVCEREARRVNEAFAGFIRTGRPFCTLKAALSVDGWLAPRAEARVAGEPFWLTGAEARGEVQRMRHGADAVVTGIGTVLADDPRLTDRGGGERRRGLLRVVLDSRLRMPMDSKLVRSAAGDVVVFCGEDAEAGRVGALESAGVEVVRAGGVGGRLGLRDVLAELARRQVVSVLLECGPALNGAFLAEGLVDKVVLFYSETELGDGAVPFAAGVGSPFLLEQGLRGVERRMFGADACVAGYVRDPWAGVASDALG